ncbi:hypothetical protein AVEN_23110-1 [Araneus ventricosus]|uniref:Uncharacterized protein n=1 Tax=Araneus ventricosus TaxID=182803 RepID=A0A4Y2VGY0_ARAVE|nr:hypothetical protein AVEN_23110-1 [Araneus ventricosus]
MNDEVINLSYPKVRWQHQNGARTESHFFPLDVINLQFPIIKQEVASCRPQAVMQKPIDTDIEGGYECGIEMIARSNFSKSEMKNHIGVPNNTRRQA